MVYPGDSGWQQDAVRVELEHELTRQLGPGGDPDKAPKHQPGDGWIILGLVGGALVGALVGGGVGFFAGLFSGAAGLIWGGLAGAIAGAFAGERFKKHLIRRCLGPSHPA